MGNMTLKSPYLTKEDKKFLRYEMKAYKENFDMIMKFHNKHQELYHRTEKILAEKGYDDYSTVCEETGAQLYFTLAMTHMGFIEDICCYFYMTRGIKELNIQVTSTEIPEETEMLGLDEVFDKYVRKYLEAEKND